MLIIGCLVLRNKSVVFAASYTVQDTFFNLTFLRHVVAVEATDYK